MHSLYGPFLKLRAAEHNTAILQADTDHHCRVNNYRVIPDFNPKTGKCIFKAHLDAPIDPIWGVRVGGICHDLRSALDGLTWQLALQKTGFPHKMTQFPIFDGQGSARKKGGDGFRGHIWRYLRSVKPIHWTMIERCQPYHGTNGGTQDPLWLLHEMNNADKHRAIHVINAIAVGSTIQFSNVRGTARIHRPRVFHGKPFEDGAVFGEYVIGPETEMTVNYNVASQIQFGKGCAAVEKLSVLDTLRAMCMRVGVIINIFVPEFGGVPIHWKLPS